MGLPDRRLAPDLTGGPSKFGCASIYSLRRALGVFSSSLCGRTCFLEGPVALVAALCLDGCARRSFHRGLRDVARPEGVARTPFGLRQTGGLSGAFDGIADRTARSVLPGDVSGMSNATLPHAQALASKFSRQCPPRRDEVYLGQMRAREYAPDPEDSAAQLGQ